MENRWLISAVALLTMAAGPTLADEKAAEPETPPVVEAPVAPAVTDAVPEKGSEKTPAFASPLDLAAPAKAPGLQLAQGTPPSAGPGEMKTPEAAPPPAPKFKYGASADFYFLSNFNDPFNGKNQLRFFDQKDEGGPHIGLLEVWAEYARDPVGFRVDLNWGDNARFNNATEQSDDDWLEHVQQLLISANLTKDGKTYIDFGKYVTPIGAEVLEPSGNWLYSQGVVFTYPIPFWHFGGRVFHYFNDTDYVMVHVNNGWGTVTKPADAGVNFGFTGSKAINDHLTVTGNYLGGDNFAGVNSPAWRNLFNVVVAYKPNADSKWSFLFDNSLGFQNDFRLTTGDDSDTAVWFGHASIAKYQWKKDQYFAGRAEILHDGKGALLGNDANVYTLALNYTRQFNKYFQTRLEYRHDFSGGAQLFADDRRSSFTGNQGTFTIAGILTY